MKPLIGVNCDTFADATGPIEGLRPAYCKAIARAGGVPVMIPPMAPELIEELLDRLDGVLLTGGDDVRPERLGLTDIKTKITPMSAERDRADFTLIESVQRRRMPALGICLGCQELNVARGGSLWLDLGDEGSPARVEDHRSSQPGASAWHEVRVESGGILDKLWGGAREAHVNSRHHQAIRTVGDGLRVLAKSPDGLVEAVELTGHPFFLAVQWHPENLDDPLTEKLFEALIGHALDWKGNAF
jgi:putative glutamine amidotransferase